MKIVYLAAGAANMYCGTCLHDNTLAASLVALGEDALLVPTYTPLRTDEPNVSQRRLFFGGINVYLQQKVPLFRHTPRVVDWLLDRPRLVSWLAQFGTSTDPAQLGDLTVSMLQGESGHQAKELDKLVDWLAREIRPDVVHLSNAMLLGMARQIHERTGAAIVCGLSGEDIFLEKLKAPEYQQARALLVERARDAAAFVALNHYYADFMIEYLQTPRERVFVIPHGLKLEGHGTRRPRRAGEVHIGYFARICHDKGLHVLVEAFRRLCEDKTLPNLRLRVAGYLGSGDRPYFDELQRKLADWDLADRFDYAGELDRAGKIEFLKSLDMLSVPTVYHESKGISILEAMANAVPVVQPEHGAFPEMIHDTQGGLLCRPEDPADLAEKLRALIVDEALADQLGRQGQQAIRARYHDREMARQTLELYRRVVASPRGRSDIGQSSSATASA